MKNRKRISRKRSAIGHKSYGKGQIKSGIKEIGETFIDQYTHGIPSYISGTRKVIKGIKHIRKSKKIYH